MSIELRTKDFERRVVSSPESVCAHTSYPVRYIPVHAFGDERSDAPAVDAWCEFPTEIALVESMTTSAAKKEEGIWIRRDLDSPRFLKVFAVLDCPTITRKRFEDVLATVADHPWCTDGFREALAGSMLIPLPLK